jgi:hypothetical protein
MRIIDGLTLEGRPAEIPDCTRDDLPQFFIDMGYKIGVEIGTYRGEYTELFAKVGLEIYAVDPWMGYIGAGRGQRYQENQDINYNMARGRLGPYPNARLIRKTSMDALNNFADESLDFAYIDGDHSFPYVAQDIYEWTKKVRTSGVVCGHDYFNTPPHANNVLCHVKAAVDAYTKLYRMNKWYVLGRFRPVTGERCDKYLSWMWVK